MPDSKRVSVAATTAEPVAPSICATLAGIELGEAHIHRAASHGFFPATQIEVIANLLISASNALKGIITHMPPHDPNIQTINDVIARIS